MITRTAGVATVLLCVAGLAIWSATRLTGEREYFFGGIACGNVRANLEAFAMGTLSDELTQQIQTHLRQCPACQELMKEMKQRPESTASGQTASCACPHCQAQHVAELGTAGRRALLPVAGATTGTSARPTGPQIAEDAQLILAQSP